MLKKLRGLEGLVSPSLGFVRVWGSVLVVLNCVMLGQLLHYTERPTLEHPGSVLGLQAYGINPDWQSGHLQ